MAVRYAFMQGRQRPIIEDTLKGERVERRLAAVLAADVAGYSRLMGADEEGTLAGLKAVRRTLVDPAIAAHRGRIVKTTGDGMLVEFASAVDAVHCDIAARDLLLPYGDVVIVLSTVLRIKRTLDGAEIDKIILDVEARKALAIEHRRRADWHTRELAASHFRAECDQLNVARLPHLVPNQVP